MQLVGGPNAPPPKKTEEKRCSKMSLPGQPWETYQRTFPLSEGWVRAQSIKGDLIKVSARKRRCKDVNLPPPLFFSPKLLHTPHVTCAWPLSLSCCHGAAAVGGERQRDRNGSEH